MSRSYTRNLNTVSLITLCPVCLHSFQDAKRTTLRRADLRQHTKDVCTYCQTRYGFGPAYGSQRPEPEGGQSLCCDG